MRFRRLFVLTLLAMLVLPPRLSGAAPPVTPLCFADVPGVAACVDREFRAYWERNGGLAIFGYPTSRAVPEETALGLRTVQHFERSRLELHPDVPEPYTVQLGLLGSERIAQLGRTPSGGVPTASGCRFVEATGHNICGAFLAYWEQHGLDLGDPGVSERESLALLGLPLSEVSFEANAAGDRVLTQWFERARLEDHGAGRVLQGLLDVEVEAALTPAPARAGFVEVRGDKLVQQGREIMLKGINYYPAAHPWAHMWQEWDGPAVARELRRARHELGINTVRVLVPYRWIHGWSDDAGNVDPVMLHRLQQFIQLAGEQQMKAIVTLFDWHDGEAPAGSGGEAYDLKYLRTIVSAFKDDDRVLAWDLHNEPDNYAAWLTGRAPAVLDWLGRMADAVRAIDRRHPLTVGVGNHANLWTPAADGRTIADLSDIISVHGYDAAQFGRMVDEVRARTTKPIVVEEFGWPSGPECSGMYFDEPSQLYLYRELNKVVAGGQLSGVVSWWFQDPPAALPYAYDEHGYYGLYRRDGSPKPAAAPFRDVRVAALPSSTSSILALTIAPPRKVPLWKPPLVFGDGMTLLDSFKHFWIFFGGEATFGRPITLAYRDQDDKLVQYFERARFELNESEHVKPIDPDWAEGQTPEVYLDRVHLTPLGRQALADRAFERVTDPGRADTRYFAETGHTLSGPFRDLWETRGEIFFGPPLTEQFDEEIDGRPTRVQYFTNFRFEQGDDGAVRLSALGREALKTRQCPRPY